MSVRRVGIASLCHGICFVASMASGVDKSAIEPLLEPAVARYQLRTMDFRKLDMQCDFIKPSQFSIEEIRPIGNADDQLVLGTLRDIRVRSFVGFYSGERGSFEFLAASRSRKLNVGVEKIKDDSAPFLLVEPVQCSDVSESLVIYEPDSGGYRNRGFINLYYGPIDPEHYTDIATFSIVPASDPKVKEIDVETNRLQVSGTPSFSKRRERFAQIEHRWIAVERTDDGKPIFSRADPIAAIQLAIRSADPDTWLRLVGWTENANSEVASKAWSALHVKMMKAEEIGDSLPQRFVERLIEKYGTAKPEDRSFFVRVFGLALEQDPPLSADQLRTLEALATKDEGDLTLLSFLARQGSERVWSSLVSKLRKAITQHTARAGCDANTAIRAMHSFAGRRALKAGERQLLQKAARSLAICDGISLSYEGTFALDWFAKHKVATKNRNGLSNQR